MGFFLTIVAQSLDEQNGDFVQTGDVLHFRDPVFVSWNPTREQPHENKEWYWLASDTLRVSKQEGQFVDKTMYKTWPVRREAGGQLLYEWELSTYASRNVVHLALPLTFTADLSSLSGNMPAYAKMNRGRLCLGWLPDPQSTINYRLTLIEAVDDFENSVATFLDQFEAAKKREPREKRLRETHGQRELLASTIRHLEGQAAIFGRAYVPHHIQYDLDHARKSLQALDAAETTQ